MIRQIDFNPFPYRQQPEQIRVQFFHRDKKEFRHIIHSREVLRGIHPTLKKKVHRMHIEPRIRIYIRQRKEIPPPRTSNPVSSFTSRRTASSTVSPYSVKPPGKSNVPLAGALARRPTSNSPFSFTIKTATEALGLK